jgi:hypothetical protein
MCRNKKSARAVFVSIACVLSTAAHAHLEEFIVTGNRLNSLIGDAIAASEGTVGQEEIAIRPILRTGEAWW